MTTYSKPIWDQLKNTTIQKIGKALEKDGWQKEESKGATQGYRNKAGRRVVLHPHPKANKGAKLLKGLLSNIGWSEDDLQRLKLIKGTSRRKEHGQEAPSRSPTRKEDAATDTRQP